MELENWTKSRKDFCSRSARDRNIERLDAAAVGVEPASARCFRVVASIDDISIISACACAPVHSVLLALPALPPL